MKIEELLDNYIKVIQWPSVGDCIEARLYKQNKAKAEILAKFEELEDIAQQAIDKGKEIEKQRKELVEKIKHDHSVSVVFNLGEKIAKLEKEVENLKCCGNCKTLSEDVVCNIKTYNGYCDNWQSDGLTAKDRKE